MIRNRKALLYALGLALALGFVYVYLTDYHRQLLDWQPEYQHTIPDDDPVYDDPVILESPPLESPSSDPPTTDPASLHTTIPNGVHVSGFTLFDNLYLRGGSLVIVTHDESLFPPRKSILSPPYDMGTVDADSVPTDEILRFIKPEDFVDELGDPSMFLRKDGTSIILYDPPTFLKHYYHWWGEIMLGFWRVYSRLVVREDGTISSQPLSPPKHIILPFATSFEWRDSAKLDGPLLRAGFPDISIDASDYWEDMMILNATVAFERVMVINRVAAHRHKFGGKWFKMIAGTMDVQVPNDFFEPLRVRIINSVVGFLPKINSRGVVIAPDEAVSSKPIITYISRQGSGRRLAAEDHEVLVNSLKELEEQGICEVVIPAMEKLTLPEQIKLAARTTIMLGVHGNGLTHQLWMPSSPHSTMIEIFVPGGYVFDYEMLARNMGHKHFAVWNDTYRTYEAGTYHSGVQYPEGFHGSTIPVYGPIVADIIRGRLDGTLP